MEHLTAVIFGVYWTLNFLDSGWLGGAEVAWIPGNGKEWLWRENRDEVWCVLRALKPENMWFE